MGILPTFRLQFRSPMHIGERGVGLESARIHASADTLFAAICSAWRALYGETALCADVLDCYAEQKGGSEPFFLTSAFPFVGNVRFFPKPLTQSHNIDVMPSEVKTLKRVRFVSERIFEAMVNGNELTFRKSENCINDGQVWILNQERSQLSNWMDDLTGDIVLWKQTVVPRVTLDRITSGSEIWHFGRVSFVEGAGLWFAVDFNEEHGEQFRSKFAAALRLLGDEGLGGERGAGHGLFDFAGPSQEAVPGIDNGDCFVTLSPICPKGAREVQALTGDGAAYELMPRRGWVTSPEASNLRRQMVWMFSEGSVLKGSPQDRPGRLVNLKPDACPHDVYRYGYAFPVGVNQQ